MSGKVNGGMPAHPVDCVWADGLSVHGTQTGPASGWATGLTKRELFAAMALQGFCANPSVFAPNMRCGWSLVNCTNQALADECTTMADALLAALAEPQA